MWHVLNLNGSLSRKSQFKSCKKINDSLALDVDGSEEDDDEEDEENLQKRIEVFAADLGVATR